MLRYNGERALQNLWFAYCSSQISGYKHHTSGALSTGKLKAKAARSEALLLDRSEEVPVLSRDEANRVLRNLSILTIEMHLRNVIKMLLRKWTKRDHKARKKFDEWESKWEIRYIWMRLSNRQIESALLPVGSAASRWLGRGLWIPPPVYVFQNST